MSPVIEARGLTKHFGRVRALEGLDLEIQQGEIFGYLGPNGAGKTTTIRLFLDFIRPTQGSAKLLGGSSADAEIRRRIGYLPGDLKFDPRYTGNDLFSFYGRLRGKMDQEYLGALVQRFDLDPSRPIRDLSSGNRRKIAIVQAFMHRPQLLLLDEPSSGLDPLLQHEFQLLLRESVDNGATVFLSSHVLPEVEVLADRVGILRKGHLVTVAKVDELRVQARQSIELHVVGEADIGPFDGMPEVVHAVAGDGVIRLIVEGSVDPVIKAAATLNVQRIVTHETELEEVFLEFYSEQSE